MPGLAKLLYENQQAWLFGGPGAYEALDAGISSVAFQLRRERGAFYPFGASFELAFNGAPGAFEIDLQTADIDEDSHYVTLTNFSTGLNSSNVGRIELPSFWARFVRAKIVTLTNSVGIQLLVTR